MPRTKSYKNNVKAAIHQTATGLYEAGLIDKQTMRDFDASCLTAIQDFAPDEIRALRERESVSQVVFAQYLNVSKDSVIKWERGVKHPTGSSLKLLNIVANRGLDAIA
jgi:putative transcriptional regulator